MSSYSAVDPTPEMDAQKDAMARYSPSGLGVVLFTRHAVADTREAETGPKAGCQSALSSTKVAISDSNSGRIIGHPEAVVGGFTS